MAEATVTTVEVINLTMTRREARLLCALTWLAESTNGDIAGTLFGITDALRTRAFGGDETPGDILRGEHDSTFVDLVPGPKFHLEGAAE